MMTGFYLFDSTWGTTYFQEDPKKGKQTGIYISQTDLDYNDLRKSLHNKFGHNDVDKFLGKLWKLSDFNNDINLLKQGRFEFVLLTIDRRDLRIRTI